MGYNSEEVKIVALISNHNSLQDDIDRKLWKDFNKELDKLVAKKKYKSISLMVV